MAETARMTDLHDIPGYNGLYQISRGGQVYSVRAKRHLTPGLDRYGYKRLKLAGKMVKLHRLLALTFLGEPEAGATVDHIDGDKSNNAIENLEWVSRSQNGARAHAAGLRNVRGANNPKAKITREIAEDIKARYAAGSTVTTIANELKLPRQIVQRVAHKRSWQDD